MESTVATKVIDAVDHTSDVEDLSLLWEVTKLRISEEAKREDHSLDRAGKYTTYSFSLLAAQIGILSYFKGSYKYLFDSGSTCFLLLLAGFFIFSFVITFVIFLTTNRTLGIRDYRTWSETDLARVDLKVERLYKRFIIKTAWCFLPNNVEINNEKAARLSQTSRLFNFSIASLFIFLILTLYVYFTSPENLKGL